MDWLHLLIEAAKAPADATSDASGAGVSGAGGCAKSMGVGLNG